MGAPERSRSTRRTRGGVRTVALAALVVVLTTVGASSGILWLAAHLLPRVVGRSNADPPVADAVELLKVALAVGMAKWVQTA